MERDKTGDGAVPQEQPRLYSDLASWFHLLTSPTDYAEEAATYVGLIGERAERDIKTVLELGSGGGNNASHMKAHYRMALVDRSPQMLDISRVLNPECEHVQGDMRTVRLDRTFDAIFVHDAIAYITSEPDLRSVIETAWAHCRPGGVTLFVPDFIRERFQTGTDHGGHDGGDRALRYLEWRWDPDPDDTTYITDFAYLLREGIDSVRVVHDRHVMGVFPRAIWLRLFGDVGFKAEARSLRVEEEPGAEAFVALKRAEGDSATS